MLLHIIENITIITEVSIFGFIIYPSSDAHCLQWASAEE